MQRVARSPSACLTGYETLSARGPTRPVPVSRNRSGRCPPRSRSAALVGQAVATVTMRGTLADARALIDIAMRSSHGRNGTHACGYSFNMTRTVLGHKPATLRITGPRAVGSCRSAAIGSASILAGSQALCANVNFTPRALRAGRLRFVLAPRRTTASLYRRHPSGVAATALALSTRQPFESHNSFLDLGAFLAQFRKNLHKFHFLQG